MLAHSKNGEMIKVGTGIEKGQYEWYFLDEKVKKFAATVPNGTEVEVRSEDRDGQKYAVYVANKGGAPSPIRPNVIRTSFTPDGRDLQITKLSCMRAAADAVNSLQGQVDVNNIADIIEKMYDRLLAKVTT